MTTQSLTAPCRRPLPRILAALIILTTTLALPTHATAQRNQPPTTSNDTQFSARASAPQPRGYIGSQIQFNIVIEGTTDAQPIELNNLPEDLRIDYIGSSQRSDRSLRIVNGRRTEVRIVSTTLQYAITPLRVGRYTIPAIEFEIEGQTLRTNPVTIQAIDTPQHNDIQATLELDHTTAFVGQPITASLHIDAVPELLTIPDILSPRSIDNARAFPLPPEKISADPTTPDARRAMEQTVRLVANGQSQPATANFLGQNAYLKRSQIELAEQPALRWTLRVIIVPTQPGTLTIDALTVRAEFADGTRRDVFGRSTSRPAILRTESQTITVNPLPPDPDPIAENPWQPALDLPLVGRFNIQSTATPATANVGDPIELTLTITGWEPINRIGRLNLSTIEPLNRRFRLPTESIPPERDDLALRYTAQIRAADERAQQIPPIRFRAFDPIERTWTTVQSEPIPLNIRPTRVVRAGDVVTPTTPNAQSSLQPTLNPSTLAPIAVSPTILDQRPFTFHTVIQSPAFIAALALPPAACCTAALLMAALRRSRARANTLTPKAAARKAIASLNAIDPTTPNQTAADAISTILRQYTTDQGLSPTDPPPPLQPILQTCDAARFGANQTTDTHQLLTNAKQAIREASNP